MVNVLSSLRLVRDFAPEEVAPSGQLTSKPNVHILLSLPANVEGEKTNDDARRVLRLLSRVS